MSDANFDADLDREERMASLKANDENTELKPCCSLCKGKLSVRNNREGYFTVRCDCCHEWEIPNDFIKPEKVAELWGRRTGNEVGNGVKV